MLDDDDPEMQEKWRLQDLANPDRDPVHWLWDFGRRRVRYTGTSKEIVSWISSRLGHYYRGCGPVMFRRARSNDRQMS